MPMTTSSASTCAGLPSKRGAGWTCRFASSRCCRQQSAATCAPHRFPSFLAQCAMSWWYPLGVASPTVSHVWDRGAIVMVSLPVYPLSFVREFESKATISVMMAVCFYTLLLLLLMFSTFSLLQKSVMHDAPTLPVSCVAVNS